MNQLFPQPAGVDGFQTLFQGCALSEKIRLETGNLVRTMSLVSVPTIGPALALTLVYNSRAVDDTGGFGYGWTHNYQARIEPSPTDPVFVDHSGRRFPFVDNGGNWELDLSEGLFEKITLTSLPGDEWQVSYYPDGESFVFDDTGRMTRISDTLGHSVDLTYDLGGKLTQVEENAIGVLVGRTIQFVYDTDTVTITDPRNNDWVLHLDEEGNLEQVEGPEGCVTTFTYEEPEDHLITGRVDPVPRDPEELPLVDQSWAYTFGGSGQLLTVTDSRDVTLTYSYSESHQEFIKAPHELDPKEYFRKTTLTDGNAQQWIFVFDLTGNLRRMIDPNLHQRRFFWSPQSQLLYEASGHLNYDPFQSYGAASTELGIRDQANMRFRRYSYDLRGNLLLALDGNGLMTHYEYMDDRLVSVTPGRANFSVQGEWQGHYGKDGHVICGATGSSDFSELPAYISALTKGAGDVEPVIHPILLPTYLPDAFNLRDSRNLRYKDGGSLKGTVGCWHSALDEEDVPYRRFQFTLEMEEETDFNLSLYTCATDLLPATVLPLMYSQQFGYDVEMLVTDSRGTQSFRIPNNAGGCWATFPVRSGEGDVLVEIRARGNNASDDDLSVVGDAVLSAIAFDPLEDRTTRMAYNEAGQLIGVVDGLGNTWSKTYDETDGTLTSSLEPGQVNPTLYFYEDAYKNLTSVEDPLEGVTVIVYDANGNVTSVTDADNRTTLFTLDGRNRVVQVEDALGNDSLRTYDAGGRLVESEDPEGRVTAFAYKHQRLWKITDALLQTTVMAYRDSGEVSSVTDARGMTTQFTYDAGNQLVETEYADQAKLVYALDSLGRVTGVTSPNGNQDDLDAIVLEGAKNALFNPDGQETRPFELNSWDTPLGEVAPRHWTPNTSANREVEATGQAYFPLNSTVHTWEQKNKPVSAGCRYLAHFLVRKEDNTVGATEARMEFQYRLHKDYPNLAHTVLSSTVQGEDYEPTSQDWEPSERSRLDIPGDLQSSLYRPGLASARLKLSSGSAPLGAKNLQLQRLSTCFEFDGENLREVCFPDGARQRTEYDRLGRAFLTRDPDGRTILREFDTLDRVVHVVDSLGNELFFEYDAKMDLVLFRLRSQGVDQDTEFEWDALHRLKTITYPDATTESFDYSAGGDLTSYEDNLSQERVYRYDALHRLDLITYPDTTTVALTYDKVGNLLTTVERDGKGWTYGYDDLNRLTSQQYTAQTELISDYNETGQRMSLSDSIDPIWTVPAVGGRDEVGRLLVVEDADSNATEMSYDVDGRCTRIEHSNSLSDLMSYDIVGKLMRKQVQDDEEETLLDLRYGYSLAGDRIAQQTDLDTFTYLTDGAGRLVEESHNRFCIDQPAIWKQGQWERLSFDESARTIQLLPFADDFSGSELNLQRWTVDSRHMLQNWSGYTDLAAVGLELRQDEGLRFLYPRALHNQIFYHRASVDDSVGSESYSFGGFAHLTMHQEVVQPRPWAVDLRHAEKLSGDFDISVDYQDIQGSIGELMITKLVVCPRLPSDPAADLDRFYSIDINKGGPNAWLTFSNHREFTYNTGNYGVSTVGQIRLVRTGSTLEGYYRAKGASTWNSMSSYSGVRTDDLYVYLSFTGYAITGSIRLTDFQRVSGPVLATSGVYTSPIYDAGKSVSWDRIQWTENLPTGCDVELEVCVADDYAEFEDYVSPPAFFGPSGGGAFTTASGQSLPSGKTGRYAMVRAVLTGNGTDTPTLSDIQLTCNSASDTGSRVIRTRYDEAGNILKITTIDDLGVSEDLRDDVGWSSGDRINTLNQIMRQDVGGDTWTFSYDLNGNMTGKTNGVDTWIYSWNDENRLVRVQGPGGVDVAYSYDLAGRMMSRDDGTDVTTFLWDGFDCIRETNGISTTTYCIPGGQLLSFVRDGERYDVHCDAVMSVRMVSDESGNVVLRREFDAFGEELSGSFDNLPGGFDYGFVGTLGCRKDPASSLVYMRQRWYAPELGRFVSKDPIGLEGGSSNLYSYINNRPQQDVDPSGLQPGGGMWNRKPIKEGPPKWREECGWKNPFNWDTTDSQDNYPMNKQECVRLFKTIINSAKNIDQHILENVRWDFPSDIPPLPYDDCKPSCSGRYHDERIEKEIQDLQRNVEKFRRKCRRNTPPPFPVPMPVPVPLYNPKPVPPHPYQVPVPVPVDNEPLPAPSPRPGPTDLVILTTAAYWIVSELSRVLFPPRNLAPIP
jgi:RHS repeat-associated protein